jgi:large conductance mechanosensitive channel
MFNEFKAFVNQGNAIDLAVGVVIGAAFGRIVNSLVTDVITPMLSLAMGRVDFENLFVPLAGQVAADLEAAKTQGAVIAYGSFLNTVVEFFIVAFSIFLVVRQLNRWRGVPAKATAA